MLHLELHFFCDMQHFYLVGYSNNAKIFKNTLNQKWYHSFVMEYTQSDRWRKVRGNTLMAE